MRSETYFHFRNFCEGRSSRKTPGSFPNIRTMVWLEKPISFATSSGVSALAELESAQDESFSI